MKKNNEEEFREKQNELYKIRVQLLNLVLEELKKEPLSETKVVACAKLIEACHTIY